MSGEIKECPFCGGEADVAEFMTRCDGMRFYKVVCDDCYCVGANINVWYGSEDKAIAVWNIRAMHGTLTAERVREAIERNSKSNAPRHLLGDDTYKAIADELNAELGGTCRNISELNENDVSGYYFICSECGLSVCADMGVAEIEMLGPRSFSWKTSGEYEFEKCPRCGKAVER